MFNATSHEKKLRVVMPIDISTLPADTDADNSSRQKHHFVDPGSERRSGQRRRKRRDAWLETRCKSYYIPI